MSKTYVTGSGEAMDLICQREYGRTVGVVERVLVENPHVKDTAHALPVGIEITLPDLSAQDLTGQPMRLWD